MNRERVNEAAARPMRRASSRKRAGGFSTIEEVLTIGAFLGFFVYPVALAARSVGQGIANSVEAAHQTILTQR